MPTYVTYLRYTQKGMENIKGGTTRLDKAKEAIKAAGGQFKSFYLTMGRYDAICFFETPDDATCAKILLSIGSQGFVQSETARAFTEEEYKKLIGGLA